MDNSKNLAWFKKAIAPMLENYEIQYNFFEEGDFGSLNQVEFNSEKIGGNIDFWELGWLGIFVWNYEIKEQMFNILLEPEEYEEKEKIFKAFIELLK